MSNVALTIQERINLVRSAIERIRDSETRLKDLGCTGIIERGEAEGHFLSARINWHNQWSNVEVILQEGLREELR